MISFGRDTLAIGRSATNVAIPVYLSTPSGSAVTVNLAVADTFAFFNPTSISIPAGQTVGTANLNGRNAGTTQVFAVDGGGSGYAGDTAVLAVQATVRLDLTSYSMNANDERPAQVQLTDPAPAGGTFITFVFGTPGRASVSPDPAFIPAGQLSANVVIRGLTAGSTTLTPAATGVNGVASTVNVAAATILAQPGQVRIGAGQFYANAYPYVTYNVVNPLVITLTSSDTTKVRVPATVTINSGTYYVYYNVTGVAPGSATITGTAPGWTGFSTPVTVTTPNVGISGGGTYNTTQPAIGMTVYTRDSTGNVGYRNSALNVQLTSSDTTVLRVLTPNVTIPAGQYFNSGFPATVISGGTPGTARLRVGASGHTGDSTTFTFVGPKLSFSWTSSLLGAGQQDVNVYVSTPNNVSAPLTVTLANSDSSFAGIPTTVTIPANSYYQYFNVRGKAPGLSTIIATAPGYSADTATYRVTSPRLSLSGGGTLDNFGPPVGVTVYSTDSTLTVHTRIDTLIVAYASSDTTVVRVTAADTIVAGLYYANRARVTPVGPGTATVTVSAPGHGSASVNYAVRTPKLNLSFATFVLGRRQYRPSTNEQYVSIPNNTATPLTVTITQTNPTADSLSTLSVTIPANSYYAYFGFAGLQTGRDTVFVTAPGYLPDTGVVVVSTPRFLGPGLPGTATTTSPPSTVTIYAADSLGSAHYSLDTLLISARSSNTSVIQPDSVGFRLPRGVYYAQARVNYVGAGTASMTYADSLGLGYQSVSTNAVTVTGPALGIYNGTPTLGMRQNGGPNNAYVSIPNAIGTALTVNLVSTDPTVATVPASVTIPSGQTYAYFQINAQDVVGTVQLQASAVGYSPVNTTQQVTAPRFLVYAPGTINTTATPGTITIYPADAAGNWHYVNENVTVTLTSSSQAVGRIDSATVVIPAGSYYNNNARFIPVSSGTVQVTASDARGTGYAYATGSATVSVLTPTLYLSWGGAQRLGVGQWTDQYVYSPDYPAAPLTVNLSHLTSASTTPASLTIPTNSNYMIHRITGVAVGNDSITYSATGHNPITGFVQVGQGRIDALGGWPGALASDSVQVTLYARDQDGNIRNVSSATTFNASVSSGAFELHVGGVAVSSVTIPADANQVSFWLRRLANGSATVTFTNANYATQVTPSVTVTGAP
ncbi:MAG: hypothetical protein OEW77_08425 [Gemmatimonadota bacterium]|nr:hypothetical protein [Gemmatimonadota bacterium]